MALVGATGRELTGRVAKAGLPGSEQGCRRRSWTRAAGVEVGPGLPPLKLDVDCQRRSWTRTAAAKAGT